MNINPSNKINEENSRTSPDDPFTYKKELKDRILNHHQQTQLMHMFYIELYGNLPFIEGLDLKESFYEKLNKAVIENENKIKYSRIEKTVSGDLFACKLCPKIYKSKENLNLHNMNYHLKQKPFTCKVCSKQFSNRMGILYHTKSFHPNLV